MQQAYFSESNKYGGWTLIGYTAPGTDGKTTNFTFTPAASLAANGTTSVATSGAWQAANNVKLNDCAPAVHWQVNLKAVTNSQEGYEAVMASDNNAACQSLTPTFTNIGK
ncbi:MAG: hypothetical protein IIU83_07305 [Fibrobacteraceae bacterium]|nr:hypothetical protein [Fibrobacteraceae bacterium]